MDITLYHNPASTCSQRVRLALAEKAIQYQTHVIDWSKWEHLSDWYLAINPNGVVPSLTHRGRPIIESSVICEYLDEVFPNPRLSPDDPVIRAKMRAWMRYFEEVPTAAIRIPSYNAVWVKELKNNVPTDVFDKMTEKMPLRKHFYREMSAEGFSSKRVSESRERLRQTLERLSNAIDQTKAYLMGDSFTLADILIIPCVVRMEDLGLTELWADLPRVKEWYERVKSRPSFATAFPLEARLTAKLTRLE